MRSSDIFPTSVTLSSRRRAMRVALGAEPADLVLRNGRLLNVFTGKWEEKDVAISGALIAATGENLEGQQSQDLNGRLLVPGFIDAHIHLESTHLWIPEISRLMLVHGVTTLVADPHEMANVRGLSGVKAMIKAAREVPLDIFFMAPSCVPASEFESPGAKFGIEEMKKLLREPDVIGVAEMMNFPGVLGENKKVWEKLELSSHVDGHIPAVSGRKLQAYIASGIRSDHETTSADEAKEKLENGMWLFIREGSAARNLDALLPAIDEDTWQQACFCTDDLCADDLMERGALDHIVRRAVNQDLSLERALTMASYNAAQAHGLIDRGAIAPGYLADLVALDPDSLKVKTVLKLGKPVGKNGNFTALTPSLEPPAALKESVNLPELNEASFRIPYKEKVRAVQLIDGQILTEVEVAAPINVRGFAEADPENDLLKAALIERHGKTGEIGLGFVKGTGIKGAAATTVAHDAHNLVVVGASDQDMLYAANQLAETGGGQILVRDGKVIARLDLPIAGLMSAAPAAKVAESIKNLKTEAQELGCRLTDPFATLSFLALSVIPKLRLTTHGLLDVEQWKIVDVEYK